MSVPAPDMSFQVRPAEPLIAEAYLHIVKRTTAALPRAD